MINNEHAPDFLIVRVGGRYRFDRAEKFFRQTIPKTVKEKLNEEIIAGDIGVLKHTPEILKGMSRAINYGFIVIYTIATTSNETAESIMKLIEDTMRRHFYDVKIIRGYL
ncbi:MAG: hypothetical protein QXO33_04150 [Nitrososphaeria archaeon]